MQPGFNQKGSTTGLGNVDLGQLQQQQAQQQVAQPKQSRQPNFFERMLPTAGGIIGGLATLPLELAPGIGTALNIASAGGGAALGKTLENKLTGNDIGSGVGASALEGGIGQFGGGLLGGLFKGVGGALAGSGEKLLANKAAQQTVLSDINPFAAVAKGNDVEGAINTMRSLNMPTTPEGMRAAASLTTGGSGELSARLRQILGGNGGEPIKVDVGNYLNTVRGAINGEPLLGTAEAKTGKGADLLASIARNKENNLFNGGGSLTQEANGNDVLDAIKYHEQQFQRYNKAVPGTEGESFAKVHQQAADYLKNQLGTNAKADAAVAAHTLGPDEAQQILDTVTKSGGSKELGDYLVNAINNAKSVSDLRSAQAPFVQADNLAKAAQQYAKGTGFVKGVQQAANPVSEGLSPGDVLGSVAGAGHPLAAGAALLGKAVKSGAAPSILENVGNTLTRMSPFTKPAAQVVANAPNYVQQPQGGNMQTEQTQGGNPYATQGGGVGSPTEQLYNQLVSSLLNAQAAPLLPTSPNVISSATSAIQALQPTLQKATTANTALQSLEDTYNQAGGGQGLAGGLLSKLGGALTGGPASLYGQQQQQLQQTLASLGIPISALPGLTSTAPAAQQGFGTVQDIINSLGGGSPILAGIQ